MNTIHYGAPNLRSACGRWVRESSADQSVVTCLKCKTTLKWTTEWFAPYLPPF